MKLTAISKEFRRDYVKGFALSLILKFKIMNFCKYFLGIFLLCFSACSNEETPQISQKELNLLKLQSIAKEMGCNVSIKLFDDLALPLTKEQIDLHRQIFANISNLNGSTFDLKPKNSSRAYESFSYYGGATYEGRTFTAAAYWQKDNQTKDITEVVAGLGGRIFDTSGDNIILYTMTHWGQTLDGIHNETIYLTLRADYTVATYPRINSSDTIDISRGPLSEIVSKVGASGQVDTKAMNGSFTIHSAGPGSWALDIISN